MKLIFKSLTVFFLLSSIFTLQSSVAYAEIPHLINYQGRLTDTGGTPLNGAYAITFRIYDAETAGNLLWEEAQTGVVVNKGIFSVLLGSVASLNLAFDKPYFLEIKVGNEVMTPRQRIASAAYAMTAGNGTPKGGIIMWFGSIANIPSGWVLCDGSNGTPDLRDKFIVGARQDNSNVAKTNVTGSLTQNGGSVAITVANLPPHRHSVGYHATNKSDGGDSIYTVPVQSVVDGGLDSGNTGSGAPYAPPYYALAFIMKTE